MSYLLYTIHVVPEYYTAYNQYKLTLLSPLQYLLLVCCHLPFDHQHFTFSSNNYSLITHPLERRRSIVWVMSVCVCVCVCVCLSVCPAGYLQNHTRDPYQFFVYVAYVRDFRSSFGTLTIGRIACRREKGDGSAQRVRSVIYDYLVSICVTLCVESTLPHALRQYRPNQYSLRNW